MTLCSQLALMCEESAGPVTLRRGGAVALTIGRCQDAVDGLHWQVIDWQAVKSGVRHTRGGSYAAAIAAFDLLGDDARRIITPAVAVWRYQALFPVGSSLEWEPAPLSAWSPPRRFARLDHTRLGA